MSKLTSALMVIALLNLSGVANAQTPPEAPKPEEQHEWLTQLAGRWELEGEVISGPDQPGLKCSGKETIRAIGPFWIVAETENSIMDMQMTGVLTLGYSPKSEKFVGTWIDSMTDYIWNYEGTLDEAQKKLTLLTEGPSHNDPNKTAKYREVLEVKDKDHKVFTSSIQADDGQWLTFVTINYTRVE